MHAKMDLGIEPHACQDGVKDLDLMHPKMDLGIETHACLR